MFPNRFSRAIRYCFLASKNCRFRQLRDTVLATCLARSQTMFRRPTTVAFRAFCLDQLEAAREQLEEEDPMRGRLAHILSDNVAELILHYQAENIDAFKWGQDSPREAIKRLQPEALEQDLQPKLRLAKVVQMISDLEADFIAINHRYRNEVYHRGQIHDRFIWDLAWHYHGFVCNLLTRVQTFGESYSLSFQFPKRLTRFGLNERDLFREGRRGRGRLLEICDGVGQKTTQPRDSLGKKLSMTIVADVEELNEAIEFITKYEPRMLTREAAIIQSQLWSVFGSPEKMKGYKRIRGAPSYESLTAKGGVDPIVALSQIIQPPVHEDNIPSWKKRGQNIAAERDPMKALVKYQALRDSMQNVYECVLRMAGGLSAHLEMLADEMRERRHEAQ